MKKKLSKSSDEQEEMENYDNSEEDVAVSDVDESESEDEMDKGIRLEDDEKPSQPIQHAFDDSDSDDDAPEEVSTSASKAHMMEIYNQQKKIRAASKKRGRRKSRVILDKTLDDETLKLLAEHTSSLGSDSVLAKENEEEQEGSKRIELDNSSSNLIHPVEKEVDGFTLVQLPKSKNASLGKKINTNLLEFQQNHFYGKRSKRVSSVSFARQKRVPSRHRKS